jgi:hypothetical protein
MILKKILIAALICGGCGMVFGHWTYAGYMIVGGLFLWSIAGILVVEW